MKIKILCEGKTEVNFINTVKKFLREEDLENEILLIPKLLGENKIKKVKKSKIIDPLLSKVVEEITNLNGEFSFLYIWLDFDIFKRKNKSDKHWKKIVSSNIAIPRKLKLPENEKPKLLLNYMNGEDFVVLMYSKLEISKWEKFCRARKHFDIPMTNNNYMSYFKKNIIKGYCKGDIPKIERINQVRKLIKNINDTSIPFASDIVEVLMKIVKIYES